MARIVVVIAHRARQGWSSVFGTVKAGALASWSAGGRLERTTIRTTGCRCPIRHPATVRTREGAMSDLIWPTDAQLEAMRALVKEGTAFRVDTCGKIWVELYRPVESWFQKTKAGTTYDDD
jgi:hypothetical protein